MFSKIVEAKAANRQAEIDEAARRLTCPVEIAKTFLRQRGFHVFSASVMPGYSSSTRLIFVGRTAMRPEAVIEMAARVKERMAA